MICDKFGDIARLKEKESKNVPRVSRTTVISRLFGVVDQARVGPRELELQEGPVEPTSVVFVGDGGTVPNRISFVRDNAIKSKGSHTFDTTVLNLSYPEMDIDDFFKKNLHIKWARAMPALTVLHFGGMEVVKNKLSSHPNSHVDHLIYFARQLVFKAKETFLAYGKKYYDELNFKLSSHKFIFCNLPDYCSYDIPANNSFILSGEYKSRRTAATINMRDRSAGLFLSGYLVCLTGVKSYGLKCHETQEVNGWGVPVLSEMCQVLFNHKFHHYMIRHLCAYCSVMADCYNEVNYDHLYETGCDCTLNWPSRCNLSDYFSLCDW